MSLFHGLETYSEKLCFVVLNEGRKVELGKISGYLRDEIESFGINFNMVERDGEGFDTYGFIIKVNTRKVLEWIGIQEPVHGSFSSDDAIIVEIEIVKKAIKNYALEHHYKTYPFHYGVTILDQSSLFACIV